MTAALDDSPAVVAAPSAVLGGADATRRYAVRCGDGVVRFAGVTRPEGLATASVLAGRPALDVDATLVEIALPVVVSDGAGPYLVDAAGSLVLAVADHDAIPGARVAIGGTGPHNVVGVVAPAERPVWTWEASARVPHERRVACLDELATVRSRAEIAAWESRWAGGDG